MRIRFVLAAIILISLASSARAQNFEVQPFLGVRFGGGFTADQPIPGGTEPVDVNLESGFTWGLTIGGDFAERLGAEFLWSRQSSAISVESATVPKTTVFDASAVQYHGNVLYYFKDKSAKTRPYVLFGFGATSVDPDVEGIDGVTKFSFGLGAGIKAYLNDRFGVRGQFRWTPTYVSSTPSLFCDAFNFCYVVETADYLNQGELTVGAIIRF